MKLSGRACTEAMSGAGEAERIERAEDSAGGVPVERRVRAIIEVRYLMGSGSAPIWQSSTAQAQA